MNIPRPSANPGVRVIDLSQIAPGSLGRVRTQQLDASLPLQPASSDELKAMLASRNAILKKPGGYANLPVRLTPQQQANLTAKLGDSLGEMSTKFYVAPDGSQGMSFKEPWVDRPASPAPDEIGQVAFKTEYGELPITLNRSKGEVMMGNHYPVNELRGNDLKQSDMESTRQMLGALNASSAAERIEITDRLQRGGFDVSTANQMAMADPEIQGGTWTDADIAEFEPLGAAGMYQRVDSPDALFSTWKQTPSQSAQMQQGDILRGQKGATDVRDLAPPMNPLYTVNRPGMKIANPEYLSAAPNRVVPFQQKTWEMVNADGTVTPLYKTVKGNQEVADALIQQGLARPIEQVPMLAPGEIYSTDRETVNVPPAFQAPEPLPTEGGYDITSQSNARQFSDKTWGKRRIEVMLPSAVLADKNKLSPHLLTGNSQIPVKELGRQRYSDDPYYDRQEAKRMIDTNPHDNYVTQRGKQFYEPMVDSQAVLDRLEQAQRRATIPYVSELNRVQTTAPYTNVDSRVRATAIQREGGIPIDQQEAFDRAMSGGMAIGSQYQLPSDVDRVERIIPRNNFMAVAKAEKLMGTLPPDQQEAFERVLHGGMTFKQPVQSPDLSRPTEAQMSQLVNRYAPVREYDRRVQFAKDAIDDAHRRLGDLPDVEKTRITTMVPNGDGYDEIVETADMSVAQRLAEARDFQERGYGQATMGLPEGVTVGAENVNALLVFPRNKQTISDTGVSRVTKNGSLQEVYPLDSRQQAQFEAEIAAGQRQVMPVGTTQPRISMSNEILEQGEPLGRAANLPVTRLNMTAEEAGNYTQPVIQQRFAVDDAESRASAGMRLRGQRTLPVADDPMNETERAIVQYAAEQRRRRVESTPRPQPWNPKRGAFDFMPSPLVREYDANDPAILEDIRQQAPNYRFPRPLPPLSESTLLQM